MSNTNELNDYKVDELYEKLLPIANIICDEYRSTIINDTTYNKLVLRAIEQTIQKIDEKNCNNFDMFFKSTIKKVFLTYIQIVIKDSSKINIIINDYIEKNIKSCNTYESSILDINKLCTFLQDIEYIPTINMIKKVLRNPKINNKIKKIVEKNLRCIIKNDIQKVFDNNIFILFIEVYCMNNNIELGYEYEDNYDYEKDTISDFSCMSLYIRDLKKYPLLTLEEEKNLAYKVLNGDQDAKDELIQRNLRLVVNIASKYSNMGLNIEDLVQEGNNGLMKAADRYNVNYGCRFSTYATYYIKSYIEKTLYKNKIISIPINLQNKFSKIKKAQEVLIKKLNREPTIEEISNYTNYTVDEIEYINIVLSEVVSLNSPVSSSNEETKDELQDFIKSDDEPMENIVENKLLHDKLIEVINKCNLTEIQRQVLISYYFENKNFVLIAKEKNFSTQYVIQCHKRAIEKLAKFKGIQDFIVYLDNPDEAIENIKNR